MRVIVLGGAGNFGARIGRALRGDPTIDLLVAGRRLVSVPGAEDVPGVVVDIGAPDFAQQLRALSPELVIHCVGPFQRQGYGVAKAALAAGAFVVVHFATSDPDERAPQKAIKEHRIAMLQTQVASVVSLRNS